MSNKEAVLIDMDGVIADTMGGMFDYMERHYGDKLAHEDIKDYMFDKFTAEKKTQILDAMRSKGFYRHLDVITGAVRGVNRLREQYNGNVYICSAPMAGAESCEAEKREWLAERFDDDFAREAIITLDKATVLGRVIIEDNPAIAGGSWRPIMFDQPYNRTITQYPRMYGWHDLSVVRECMQAESDD